MNDRSFSKKKQLVKEIIGELHQGLSAQEAEQRIQKEVGSLTSAEIAEIEQSLIDEGVSPEQIKKFCNVHSLIFRSSLHNLVAEEKSPHHPIRLFKQENREIEKMLGTLKKYLSVKGQHDWKQAKKEAAPMLEKLAHMDTHYVRKEQLLFPFLEKYGFMGPSKVMWQKHDEIRDLGKQARLKLKNISDGAQWENYTKNDLKPLVDEAEEMIFKEENILFPAAQEKLGPEEWVEILKESQDIGYVWIDVPQIDDTMLEEIKESRQQPSIGDQGVVSFPTGALQLKELMHILNTLPVDLTFVDKDDKVKYFSDNKDRIFVRTRSVIGREVRNCHPPQSVDAVEGILEAFKNKKRDHAHFWINLKGRMISIQFFAIRDENAQYLGTLEAAMDITDLKKLEGERRLLDEGN